MRLLLHTSHGYIADNTDIMILSKNCNSIKSTTGIKDPSTDPSSFVSATRSLFLSPPAALFYGVKHTNPEILVD